MKETDEEIILKLQAEFEPRLFSELIGRHRGMIKNKCMVYVRNSDIAEDLCQDILIKLYLKLESFKSDSRFTTWLFSIIHNHCMDYLKKNRKEMHQEITEKLSDEVAELMDHEEELSRALSEELLNGLLEQITPEGKLILLLKYKEHKSIKEIQTALNINESTVKMRLKRAKDKINHLYNSSTM
jgi:RNA polymerase sigma-70 factor (ECF subfamily)